MTFFANRIKIFAYLVWAFFLLYGLCAKNHLSAQTNLVLNGSFEEKYACPIFTNSMSNPEINLAKFWLSPTYSSPDYFHTCNPSIVPANPRGYQYPRTGEGYAGIVAFVINWNNGREYIQGTLKNELIAEQQYYVEYYVSLCSADYRYPTSNIDLYFSDSLVYYNETIVLSMFNPQIKNNRTNIIKDTLNWVKISGIYTAKGGEKYIIIGNLSDSTEVYFEDTQVSPYVDASYYFIDDVAVYSCADTILCADTLLNPTDTFYLHIPNIFTPNTDGKNDTWQVKASGVQQLYAAVYNRWGSLLWQQEVFADSAQNELNLSWDGRSSTGMPASAGTYYYLVTCTTKEGEIKKEKGFLTLTN